MKRFIEGEDRTQVTLLPACLEDYVEAENPVRVVGSSSMALIWMRLASLGLTRRRRAGPRITRRCC